MQPNKSLIQRLQETESPPSWSLLLALFFIVAFLILWIAGQIISFTLRVSFGGAASNLITFATPQDLALGALIGNLAALLGVILWARRRFQTRWINELHLFQPRRLPLFAVVLLGLGAAWLIDLIGVLLKIRVEQIVPPVLDTLRNPIGPVWVATAVFAIVIQPIAEGLIFDGLLYPALAHDLRNNLLACATVAVIYTLINIAVLSAGAQTWYLLMQPFLMALVVALIRAYTQSTQAAIVARALFGLFFVLAALISLRA